MQKIKELALKYKDIILYLVFGIGTTVVDFAVTFLLYRAGLDVHFSDVVAWCGAVIFAFATNRALVFHSEAHGALEVAREFIGFAASRALTLAFQELSVFFLHDCLEYNKYIVKAVASVIVIIVNYLLSKLVVFGRRGGNKRK